MDGSLRGFASVRASEDIPARPGAHTRFMSSAQVYFRPCRATAASMSAISAAVPVSEHSVERRIVSLPADSVTDTISADAAAAATIADLHFAAGAKRPAYRTKWA